MRPLAAVGLFLVSVAVSSGVSTPRLQATDESDHNGPFLPAGSIVLPDSLGGVATPERIALNPTNARVYVSGGGVNVAVIDAATGGRVSSIPLADAWEMQYNPIANVLYLWTGRGGPESYELATVDCTTDSIVAQELLTLWPICVNLRDNKLYAAIGREHTSAVAVLDGHTRRLITMIGSARISGEAIGWGPIVWNSACDRVYYSDGGGAIAAIDGRTDREVARVPQSSGLEPRCVNPRNNKLYASSLRTTDSSFAVIDCRTNHVVAWLPIYAADAVYNPVENKVYCSSGGVVVIDGKRNTIVRRVDLDFDTCLPAELCFDSLNNRMYCFGGMGGIAVIDCRSDSVIWTTGAVAAHRPVFFGPANRLYCVDWRKGDVYAVNSSTFGITDTLTLGYRVKSMLYSRQQDRLYCANDEGHALAAIDCGAGRVRGTIEVGRKPSAFACSPDGDRLYCTNAADGTVSVIDCESDQVIASIKTGGEPTSLCINSRNHRLFCAAGSGKYGEMPVISVIDYRTDSIVARLAVGSHPRVIYDSLHDRVFCASYNEPWNKPATRISAFKGKSLGRSFNVELQGAYWNMCYDPVLDQMYVARMEPGEVAAIDCKSGVIRWAMRTAGQPTKLLYNPRQRRLYVASYEWTPSLSAQPNDSSRSMPRSRAVGAVEVVNPNSGSSIARIEVADEPRDLLYVPEVDRIYCACASSDTVVAIDCATSRIVDRQPVGARPVALAYSPKHGVVYVANSEASSVTPISISNVPSHR